MREAGGGSSRRWTITGSVVAAAVLVAAGAFGARAVLAGDDEPKPPAATTLPPTPTGSAGAGAAPATSTSTRTVAVVPKSIPARAFLQASDAPGKAKSAPERLGAGDQKLPEFCDATYDRSDRVGVRATQVLYISGADDPAEATPKAAVYEDVIVFRGDGATAFMADLRTAVRDCASLTDNGVVSHNYQRGSVDAGAESLLIERTRPAFREDGEPVGDGSLHHLYWAAVRVGDSVAFVTNAGWESGSAERADTVLLAQRAAARLAAWRR